MTVAGKEPLSTGGSRAFALLHRNRRALRDALILIGLIRAAVYYVVVGIGWILPAMPLMRWMLTGKVSSH